MGNWMGKMEGNYLIQDIKIEFLIFIYGTQQTGKNFLIEMIQLNFFCYKKFEIRKNYK